MADNRLPEEGDRIAKLLARAGIASRREIERMILAEGSAVETVPLAERASAHSLQPPLSEKNWPV